MKTLSSIGSLKQLLAFIEDENPRIEVRETVALSTLQLFSRVCKKLGKDNIIFCLIGVTLSDIDVNLNEIEYMTFEYQTSGSPSCWTTHEPQEMDLSNRSSFLNDLHWTQSQIEWLESEEDASDENCFTTEFEIKFK